MEQQAKRLEVHTTTGLLVFDNVDEYVSGYRYFYIRNVDANTISIPTEHIEKVDRVTVKGQIFEVCQKTPKPAKPRAWVRNGSDSTRRQYR
jgi:hypothetical protein